MQSFLQDLRFSFRQLRRSPGFALTALLTLALGIGATVVIFTFLDAAIIRPLPYRDPARLVGVFETRQQQVVSQFEASYPDFLDWKKQNDVFESISGYSGPRRVIYSGASSPQIVQGDFVSDSFFGTLGVDPIEGRSFRSGEDLASSQRTVILSYNAWQRRFGGRPDAIGQTLVLDGEPNTIIGVLPRSFHFAPVGDPEVWVTLHATGPLAERRSLHWLNVVARIKPGVSPERAGAALNTIAQRLEQDYPASNHQLRTALVPLSDLIVGKVRPILLVLFVAVALLLLIACANVANLLMVRSASRMREIAIRTALGARRGRLLRQLLTEGLLLVTLGGTLGLVGAEILVRFLVRIAPATTVSQMPYFQRIGIDGNVVLFSVGISLLTGLLFALAPSIQMTAAVVSRYLKEGSYSFQAGSWRRLGKGLVIAELAVSVVLLVGAALLVKSLHRLMHVDTGFDTDHLTTLRIVAPDSRYSDDPKALAFEHKVMEATAGLPGVQSLALADVLPIGGGNTINFRRVEEASADNVAHEANIRSISPGYFTTLRARLNRGRWFTDADDATAPQRIIINQTLAKLIFQSEDPVGKQVIFTFSPKERPREIVGVVDDIKEGPLDAAPVPALYLPTNQSPDTSFNIVARTDLPPESIDASFENTVHQIDPDAVVYGGRTMQQIIDQSPSAYLHRYSASFVGWFATIALVLGIIGLYGAVAYSVSQRTQEIGLRMALGAQPSSVLKLVLWEGGRLAIIGSIAGLAGSAMASHLLRGMLFGVKAWDLSSFAIVTGTLVATAMLASYLPARRAASIDPMQALRNE